MAEFIASQDAATAAAPQVEQAAAPEPASI
jgi:hypothetical protein